MIGIDELIVFSVQSSAYWRRQKAEQFPEDQRNAEAAEILERLAPELHALEGTALHERVARLAEQHEDGTFGETLSELLRSVGFRSFPSCGKDFLDEFISDFELRPELKSLRSITHISDLLLQSVLTVGKKTDEGRLVECVTVPWFDIIEILKKDPSAAFEIPSRTCEEIIAGAYKKAGFEEVILTPRSATVGACHSRKERARIGPNYRSGQSI